MDAKKTDLGGGILVWRVLPQRQKRMVGPFCFLDEMGPVTLLPNQSLDVRPHPHIGLSTLTYLFEGRVVHRDSLGTIATIEPGEVNWMTAGRGISHSERSDTHDRQTTRNFHGLQFWVALPDGAEETDPQFRHYEKEDIPSKRVGDVKITVVAGQAFGLKSGVQTSSPLLFAVLESDADVELALEVPPFELGIYVVRGSVQLGDEAVTAQQLFVSEHRPLQPLRLSQGSRVALIGGEPFSTPRHIWWNLVSSSKERIEVAKNQWKQGQFPMVPGETEFIPLPESV